MADDDEIWTYVLQGVSRISPEGLDPDDGAWPTYSVTFDCSGPNFSAEVEVFVDEVVDEAQIIALAMSALHVGFATWARVTAGRHIANDDQTP